MKKYKINNKIVEAKTVLDAIAKVKDAKYIIQHKHNSNSTVGEDGLFHFGGIKYAKRFDTISEAINHANSMSSNWEKLYDIVEIKDSVKDSYIYADLGQDYKKNADDIRKMGLKVSFMGRSDGYGMYGKIEGTRQQLERLQELGYFENEIIKDSISQEYEEIRKQIGEKKYNAIQEYLKTHKNFLLSDIYYNQDAWNKFETWYNNGMKDSVKDAKMTPDRMVQIITPIVREFAKKKGVEDYWQIHKNGKNVSVGIELSYKGLDELCDILNKKLEPLTDSYFEPADGGLIETTIFDSVKDSWLSDLSKKQFAKAKEQKGLYSRTQTKYEYLVDLMKKVRPEFKIGDYVEVRFPHFIAQIIDVQFMPDSAIDNENFAWQYLLKVTDNGNTTYRVGEVADRAYYEWEFKKVSKPVFDSIRDANVDILNKLIAEEEKAIKDYKFAIENDTDEQAISLYKHILNEEIEHLEELKTLLNGRMEK